MAHLLLPSLFSFLRDHTGKIHVKFGSFSAVAQPKGKLFIHPLCLSFGTCTTPSSYPSTENEKIELSLLSTPTLWSDPSQGIFPCLLKEAI